MAAPMFITFYIIIWTICICFVFFSQFQFQLYFIYSEYCTISTRNTYTAFSSTETSSPRSETWADSRRLTVSIHPHCPSLLRLWEAIRLHREPSERLFSVWMEGCIGGGQFWEGQQCPGQQASALMGPSQALAAFLACLPGFPPPHYYLQSKQTSCSRRPKPCSKI